MSKQTPLGAGRTYIRTCTQYKIRRNATSDQLCEVKSKMHLPISINTFAIIDHDKRASIAG